MATGTQVPYFVEIDVTADATAGIDYTLIHPGLIVDATFHVSAAGGAGTVCNAARQAQGAGSFTNFVTAGLAATSATAVSRAATLVTAQQTCAAGDVIRAITTDADIRGTLIVTLVQAPQQ